ncbi:hypothetical protein E4U14_008370 [Claviceps sp. LM454 group G7]|nr:hypothetical protein E4U14_008370 [Claviceps sp. LM454 group G7]
MGREEWESGRHPGHTHRPVLATTVLLVHFDSYTVSPVEELVEATLATHMAQHFSSHEQARLHLNKIIPIFRSRVDHDEEHRDASSEDILWRQLKVKYEIDSLASRDDLSVEQKVKALQEKKHRLRESTPTATNAERANAFADQTSVLASL